MSDLAALGLSVNSFQVNAATQALGFCDFPARIAEDVRENAFHMLFRLLRSGFLQFAVGAVIVTAALALHARGIVALIVHLKKMPTALRAGEGDFEFVAGHGFFLGVS